MSEELKLQKKVRKAVKDHKGLSITMSHRFVVGIPDLMVKLPDFDRTAFLEVKQRLLPTRIDVFELPVTARQKIVLRDMVRADIPAGVLSILRERRRLYAAILGPGAGGWSPDAPIMARVEDHFEIDIHCAGVVPLIEQFLKDWDKP